MWVKNIRDDRYWCVGEFWECSLVNTKQYLSVVAEDQMQAEPVISMVSVEFKNERLRRI